MDEGILAIVAIIVVVYVVFLVIAAVINIGLILLAGIALVGALRGVFVAGKNFWLVLEEAHAHVPR